MIKDNAKQTGSFYTPEKVALFLTQRILVHLKQNYSISILEPSCGDGVFIKCVANSNIKHEITAIDINAQEVKRLKSLYSDHGYKILQKDYIHYHFQCTRNFDLVIGNPPYISYARMTKNQINLGNSILNENGLGEKSINNIWEPFLVSGVSKLSDNGVLCFILPVEILQVKYAERLRKFLQDKFNFIEIIHFNKPIYRDILQDVISIICYKKHEYIGIREVLYDTDMHDISVHSDINRSFLDTGKWTSSVLNKRELECIESIRKIARPISCFVTTTPGIVTGNNDFFILSETEVLDLNAQDYVKPIIHRSSFINSFIKLHRETHDIIKKMGKHCFLLDLNNVDLNGLPKTLKQYINDGNLNGVGLTYKTKQREHWYVIPNVKTGPAIFFKRSHLNIKFILNPYNLLITDTGYLVYPKIGHDIEDIVYSFYNTFSLTMVELLGRFYGGGVLELVPSEFRSVPILYTHFTQLEKKTLAKLSQPQLIDYIDHKIGISNQTKRTLTNARSKLIDRRISRRN